MPEQRRRAGRRPDGDGFHGVGAQKAGLLVPENKHGSLTKLIITPIANFITYTLILSHLIVDELIKLIYLLERELDVVPALPSPASDIASAAVIHGLYWPTQGQVLSLASGWRAN
jgi:hypothetical protein